MIFFISILLTSFIGFLICYRIRENLALVERIFISIFLGWGYFSNLILFFNTNFPEIDLNEKVLFALIVLSLCFSLILFIIIKRRLPRVSFKKISAFAAKLKLNKIHHGFHNLKPKYYLIIPILFLALILLSITINTFWYKMDAVDPIFQWDQRGELIFLEKSVSGARNHLFGYYPLHTASLHSWAYFFNFNNARILYLISLIGLLAIIIQNIYSYSKSMYSALVFSAVVVSFQVYYTTTNYAEGIGNVYFFLGALYALKYLKYKNIAFILLGSFFMTMHANTRSEGILYWGILLFFIILISIFRKTFRAKHILLYILPLFLFYFIPKANFTQLQGGSNLVMHTKIILKCVYDIFSSWGEIYNNELLKSQYYANSLCCAILSFFAFWDSLFFDPQKVHIYNLLRVFLNIMKQFGLNLWILLILIMGRGIKNRETIIGFLTLIIFPLACFIFLYNYLQIAFYYDTNVIDHVITSTFKRYSSPIFICLIFFLSTNKFIKEIFTRIEQKKVLAYSLNLPFLYILLKQTWGMVLIR